MKSLGNKLYNLLDYILLHLNCFFSSTYNRFKMNLMGIEHGNKIKFYGNMKFKKANGSTIAMGNRCVFRSSFSSNLLGINKPCIISACLPNAKIQIGEKCGFSGTSIFCFSSITIKNNVRCGANTMIFDGDAHLSDPRTPSPRPVIIGNNVWLGANVIILKGVTIGDNTIIGAGSVVSKSIPENVIACGNPCKIIRTI